MTRKWIQVERKITLPSSPFLTSPARSETVRVWHTETCVASSRQWEAERAAYVRRWPDYCRNCDGAGGFTFYFDPSPPGVSLSPGSMECFDPCSECSEAGRCPRCGERISPFDDEIMHWMEDETPCPHCGWNWCRNLDDSIPQPPECACYCAPDHPERRKESINV